LSTIPSINESTEVEILQNEIEFIHDQIYDNIANINNDVYDCIVINVHPDNNYNNNIIASIENNKDLINNNISINSLNNEESKVNFVECEQTECQLNYESKIGENGYGL